MKRDDPKVEMLFTTGTENWEVTAYYAPAMDIVRVLFAALHGNGQVIERWHPATEALDKFDALKIAMEQAQTVPPNESPA